MEILHCTVYLHYTAVQYAQNAYYEVLLAMQYIVGIKLQYTAFGQFVV